MNSHLIAAIQYAHANSRRFLEDLKTFTRIPSVSTNPEAKPAMQQAAQWIADNLINLGIQQVQIMATRGHPVVYGELLVDRAEAVTVLVYGHYDVQPAEPLELWESGAFDPTVRGEHIFALD